MMVLLFYPILALVMYYLPAFSNQIIELPGEYWVPQSEAPSHFKAMDWKKPLLILVSFVPISIILEWYRQSSEIASLEKEKSATELNLLKQQINPHFFFNTLNNLYALSITKDIKTPEVIMQLSELMRYVIYKGKEEQVLIKEEVKYIEDYVQLQQIRLHKSLDFQFDKKIANPRLKIPPLLFIILVENAFKHGIETAERDCFLHIQLESDKQGSVTFTCKNSVERKNPKEEGMGLENLRRRLALRFPERHQLITEEKEGAYQVFLKFRDDDQAS